MGQKKLEVMHSTVRHKGSFIPGGGETYLESENWDGIENWRYRQTDSTAIQIEVMHSTAWHKGIFVLYAMPGWTAGGGGGVDSNQHPLVPNLVFFGRVMLVKGVQLKIGGAGVAGF